MSSRPHDKISALSGKIAAMRHAQHNPVGMMTAKLQQALSSGTLKTRPLNNQQVATCLARYFSITTHRLSERRLYEALPYLDPIDTIQSFRAVLFRLGFTSTLERVRDSNLRAEFLPCFYQSERGELLLIERMENRTAHCYDPISEEMRTLDADSLVGVFLFPETNTRIQHNAEPSAEKWSRSTFQIFRPLIGKIFLLSMVTNLFALVTPLYVMTVYDKAIGAKAYDVLFGLTVAILLIVITDFILREIKGRLQAYMGARLDSQVNQAAFQQLLYLPLPFTQDAPLGAQLTRLKQMTSVRDAFTGTLANAIFDLPFLVVFLAAIAIIGGPLVFAPLGLMVLYAVMAAWALPHTKALVRSAGEKKSSFNNLTVEALSSQNAIFDLNAEDIWFKRYRGQSAQSSVAGMKSRQINVLVQTLSQSLVSLAGLLTLAIGVSMVLNGSLSSGALIAVMALGWRVLGPIRNVMLSSLSLGQTIQSFEQIDRLLKLRTERNPFAAPSIPRQFKGQVAFDRISFRYPGQKEPALRGVTFDVKPGELVCICGGSGSGKSTTLRMIAGLYQQQAGSIFIDGLDLRQIDLGEWRQAIGVALEESDLFFGTIAQNLRLASPSATDAEIDAIAKEFGLDQFYGKALAEGLNTKITGARLSSWPEALKKRICLARCFIREAPLYLLDTPADNLDSSGEKFLLEMIERKREHSAIIMTTHRPSHMKLAHRLLWLDNGMAREFGDPEQILPQFLSS